MSVRGGRTPRGLWAAERQRRVALLLVLLTASSGLVALAPTGDAQSPSDPWWGSSDRLNPTRGWAVRVPLVVENTREYTLSNPIVVAEVDFGKLLVAAGWTNRTTGTETTLRGFTLDVGSIRVVEYGRGFSPGPIEGSTTKPIAHQFYQAPLTGARTRDFDPQRNPSGTIVFALQGDLAPQARRFFYVYANPLEYADAPMAPHPHTYEERAAVDSFLWGTSGTVFYGYEPQQAGRSHFLQVRPLTDGGQTKVWFYQNTLGRFNLIPPTATTPNPLVLDGGMGGSFYVPAGTPYKVVADRPVTLVAHGPTSASGPDPVSSEWRGFVPSTTGSFAGTDFWVYGGAPQATGTAASPRVQLTVIKATPGTATVSATGAPNSVTLTAANPTNVIEVPQSQWSRVAVTGGAKVLLAMGTPATAGVPFQGHQVPAVSGGPVGVDFFVPFPQDGGFASLCRMSGNATLRIVDPSRPAQQLDPEGPLQTTDPYKLVGAPVCKTVRATTAFPKDALVEFYSIKPTEADPPEPFSLQVGAEARPRPETIRPFVGFYGGEGGTSFFTRGKVGIFGHYNDTRVTMFVEREKNGVRTVTNQTFAVSQDGFQSFDPTDPTRFPDATGRLSFVTTKPVVVVSLEPVSFPYQVFVPGRPDSPHVTVGAAEFRGPLVELRSREKDARQDFRSTGPGTSVTFPLEVVNLGRWIAGEGLADTVTLTCTSVPGWTVDGCGRQISLGAYSAERVNLNVTPPADALNVNGTFTVEARSKHGNVVSTMRLIVFVEIRYGVGMWFDVEGGRKTIDPPIGVDPGETYRYNVLVKNTGSARDRFEFTVEPEARPGWTQALLLDGEAVDEISLEGGESRTLTFVVTAPDQETAQQNIVSIRAQSVSSALAADVVNTATRIRPKVSISMDLDPQTRVAEPNETAVFNVTVTNTGNDIFLVMLRREGLLPAGWNASFNLEPPEVNLNPNPTKDPNLSYTFQLRVTPPPGARAGDLATLKLTAETDTGGGVTVPGDEASAVVVVRKVHNVTTPPLLDARTGPGETFAYVLPVTNHGNGNDVLELLPGAVEARLDVEGANASRGWTVESDAESLYLDHNESTDLPLRVGVPEGAPPGLYNVTFTLRLSREAFQNLTIPVFVEETPRVVFRGPERLPLAPGRAHEVRLSAVNTGNIPGEFDFEAEAPPGWGLAFRPARARLDPGESVPVVLTLNATRDAADGDATLRLDAILAGRPAGGTPLTVAVARPDLHLEAVEARGSTRPGELVVVEADVRNSGGITAENVTVALFVDGQAVDAVVLSRIPIGQTATATLSWVSTHRTSDLRVVVDPGNEIVQRTPTEEDDAAAVTFASRVPLSPWLGLVALVAAALLLRKGREAE